MSKGIGAMVAAGVVGVVVWAFTKQAPQQATIQRVSLTKQPTSNDTRAGLFGGIFDAVLSVAESGGFDMPGTIPTNGTPPFIPANSNSAPTGGGLSGLLGLIGGVEAPEGYNQVYGGISAQDRPSRPLTSMTVGEVLAWQDSIDPRYNSEAAGRYQVMEDTLRGLVREGKVSTGERFDQATQDRIAVHLMERRGLSDYQAGRISETKFANNLAKEWASLPVVSGSKTGRSYYAGDGLNKALVGVSDVLSALRGV